MSKSFWEEALLAEIRQAGLPEPEREFRFSWERRFRFDFAWPQHVPKTAAEVNGGTYLKGGGRHNRPQGMRSDAEKTNLANVLGWRVYQFTTDMVKDRTAIDTLKQVFKS